MPWIFHPSDIRINENAARFASRVFVPIYLRALARIGGCGPMTKYDMYMIYIETRMRMGWAVLSEYIDPEDVDGLPLVVPGTPDILDR